MDASRRNRLGVLAALVAVLILAVWWRVWPGRAAAPAAPTRKAASAAVPDRGSGGRVSDALDLRLERLERSRNEPEDSGRDPFRYRPSPPPPPPPPPTPLGGPAAAGGGSPTASGGAEATLPPPPPIALKFIGVVTREAKSRIAVLSDGKFVFHGREGDIIEGRFRVVRIGEESVQMEYLDGRGRQTIRLSGS